MLVHDRRTFTSSLNCTRTPAALAPVDPAANVLARSSTVTFSPEVVRW
jgi:hypothetical protein